MTYVYISPDTKPSRWLFYFTSFVLLAFSVFLIWASDSGIEFPLVVLASFILYTCIGVIILHFPDLRDKIFGKTACPLCKKNVITIKDKLKAKCSGKPFSKCSSCHRWLAQPWKVVFHMLILIFAPILSLFIHLSMWSMFVGFWGVCIPYSLYFGRRLELVRYRP